MYAALALTLLLPVSVFAAEASFSYDPSSPVGPENWADVDTGDKTNECGGMKQSGINVPTAACDELQADYNLTVSCVIAYCAAFVIIYELPQSELTLDAVPYENRPEHVPPRTLPFQSTIM